MILLARHLFDPFADRVASRLGRSVRVCSIERWLAHSRIRHRVGNDGASTELQSDDGELVRSEHLGIVFNRVRCVPVPQTFEEAKGDRNYAAAEATALFWSCLESMGCPVLNTAIAMQLVGRTTHPMTWVAVAAAAGLRTRDFWLTTTARRPDGRTMEAISEPLSPADSARGPAWLGSRGTGQLAALWIVGSSVLGQVAGVSNADALRFARTVGIGFGVLQFELYADDTWRLSGYDTFPMTAPTTVVDALIDLLASHAECDVARTSA